MIFKSDMNTKEQIIMINMEMIGKKCSLIPLKESDALKWAEWYNDIYISLPESNVYDVFALSNTEGWVKHNIKNNDLVFSIIDNHSKTVVGKIELELDSENSCGSFGIVIGEREYWGRGLGKEATLLLLDFAFNKKGIHNMMLGVYAFNKRAINLYEQIGFKEIGRRREYQAVGGRRFDMIFMDMLSSEFKGLIK